MSDLHIGSKEASLRIPRLQQLVRNLYIGKPKYRPYTTAPIKLQAHGDPSPPLSFRNIWVRELP